MNKIYLNNLPRDSKGIIWNKCANCVVHFNYRNIDDYFIIKKNLDVNHVLIIYKNKEYELPKVSLVRCCLGKLFNFGIPNNFKYKENEIKNNLKITEQTRIAYGKKLVKGYIVSCIKCRYNFKISEANLSRGDSCPVCSNHIVIKGINDINTTRPDISKNFTNIEDGFKYTVFSNVKVDFTCSKCREHIGLKSLDSVSISGFSCPKCGDGISYPNKFMYNLLKILNEDFDTEVVFDWCVFKKYNSSENTYGIYDFVIDSKKIIIEMDGGIGHGNIIHSKSNSSIEEDLYRDNCKTNLAMQNGYEVIRIDCFYKGRENRYNICRNAILNSKLSDIYDLSNVDWDELNKLSLSSFIIQACKLYNNGYSVLDISKKLKKSISTIYDYIHIGSNLSLC